MEVKIKLKRRKFLKENKVNVVKKVAYFYEDNIVKYFTVFCSYNEKLRANLEVVLKILVC